VLFRSALFSSSERCRKQSLTLRWAIVLAQR